MKKIACKELTSDFPKQCVVLVAKGDTFIDILEEKGAQFQF
jgi:hypothetical protein